MHAVLRSVKVALCCWSNLCVFHVCLMVMAGMTATSIGCDFRRICFTDSVYTYFGLSVLLFVSAHERPVWHFAWNCQLSDDNNVMDRCVSTKRSIVCVCVAAALHCCPQQLALGGTLHNSTTIMFATNFETSMHRSYQSLISPAYSVNLLKRVTPQLYIAGTCAVIQLIALEAATVFTNWQQNQCLHRRSYS